MRVQHRGQGLSLLSIRTAIVSAAVLLGFSRLSSQVFLQNAFPNLTFSNPVFLCAAPDTSDRVFVVSQDGYVFVFPNNSSVTSTDTFLNISDSVISNGEMGLLSIAFHPNYQSNGYFFADYIVPQNVSGYPYASVISRFHVSANPDSAVRSSEVVLMRINQPYDNHKGGQLAFGPDGYLYIGLGDGGSAGDPHGNGQSKSTWLAKILRINVDSAAPGLQYSVPATNPFVNLPGAKKEIFAYGLRNPWRFSFDYPTRVLWVADVGQNDWEEVDTVKNGGNYGWNTMEAFHCYNPPSGCDSSGLSMPLLEYGHVNSQCSITGGYVYRGQSIPALSGFYVYGDFCAGRIWAFDSRVAPYSTNYVVLNSGKNISAFGVDKHQELYLCSYSEQQIYKFAALPPVVPTLRQPAYGQSGVSRTPTLRWSHAYNAQNYHVQVATDSNSSSPVSDTLTGDTSKSIGVLSYSTIYYWHVNASNSGGTSAFSPTWHFTTVDPPAPPPQATLVSPANGATNEPSLLRLVWQVLPTADSYRCQLALDSNFSTIVLDDTALTDSFRQVGPLIADTSYYWRVRGKNFTGIGPYSATWSFRTSLSSTIFQMLKGWNLISLPLSVENPAANVLYPGAVSRVFAYVPGSGYVLRDSLLNGIGYWIKYPDTQSVSIAGVPISSDSADVFQGWNMVGSVNSSVAAASVLSSPPGLVTSQFFEFIGHYSIVDSLLPGKGYWVKVSQPGRIYLNSAGSLPGISRGVVGPIRIQAISGNPPDPPSEFSAIPRKFLLDQNYPNPFNPSATIHYVLPEEMYVSLIVYNVLGEKVATLVNGVEESGDKFSTFFAENIPSGIYFYRLNAGNFSQTRKLVVAR